MYQRAIVNECGEVIEYVSNLTEAEVSEILEQYPEYRITCILIEM